MKRFLSVLLTLTMAATMLVGCGSEGNGSGQENSEGTTASGEAGDETTQEGITSIKVEMINYGYDDPDLQMVQDAINEITEEKIGVHVEFMTVPIAEMATKLELLVSGGEEIDLVQTGLLTTPSNLVASGLLQPITEYVNASDTLKNTAGELLEACTINGDIYVYPGSMFPGKTSVLVYDKTLAAEYNIDMPEEVTSQEELTPIFQKVLESGMQQYAISLGDGVGSERNFGYAFEGLGDSVTAAYGVILDPINGTEVVNWYETEEYKNQSKIHEEWFKAGYVVPDSISNGYTVADSMSQGQCFSVVSEYNAGMNEAYFSQAMNKEVGLVKIGNSMIDTSAVISCSWGIPATSTKAQATMDFLELMNEDIELQNLYNYGIEGVHYVVTEGSKIIDYPEGVDTATCGYGAFIPGLGNSKEMYARAPLSEDFFTEVDAFGMEKSEVSKYMGYVFDPSEVATEVTAVTAKITEYAPSLNCGILDTEIILPQFVQALKDAGIDKIIAENQRQLDEWLAQR